MNRSRSTISSIPAIDNVQRNVRPVPVPYSRKAKEIPHRIPHKKLLEKIENYKDEIEPLTDFRAAQIERYLRERKPSKIHLDPISIDGNESSKGPKKKKSKLGIAASFEGRRKSSQVDKVRDPLKTRPVVPSQQEVIDYIKNNPSVGFLYMVYAVPKNNVYFTPYYLKVVPYDQIDRTNYLTISPCGVTHYTSEMVFTKMKNWEQEYQIFNGLTEIKFFRVFRYWKAFYVWRKSILYRKYTKNRNSLYALSFYLNPILGKALLNIQLMCCEMYMKSFADVSRDMDIAYFYFIEVQMKRVEIMREKLIEYRAVVLEVITQACHIALYRQGFTYDDRNVAPFQIVRGKSTGGMSYTEKANKRKFCERLACFIKLTDFMTNYMLYRLTKRSNAHIAGLFRQHVSFTPCDALLDNMIVDEVLEDIPRKTDNCLWALFQTDALVLPSGMAELNPSQNVVATYLDRITGYWDECIRQFHNFLNEPTLDVFVQPTIMGKKSRMVCWCSP